MLICVRRQDTIRLPKGEGRATTEEKGREDKTRQDKPDSINLFAHFLDFYYHRKYPDTPSLPFLLLFTFLIRYNATTQNNNDTRTGSITLSLPTSSSRTGRKNDKNHLPEILKSPFPIVYIYLAVTNATL